MKVRLTSEQQRRLSKFWQRQKSDAISTAESAANRRLRDVFGSNGTINFTSLPTLAGDLTGRLEAAIVQGIFGIPIDPTAPMEGQALTYDSGSNQLKYRDSSGAGRWEPVVEDTDGDPDTDPEFVFDGGDIVMEEVFD